MMCSNTTDEIDDLALTVEAMIAQNERALAEHEEEHVPPSEFQPSPVPDMDAPNAMELFS